MKATMTLMYIVLCFVVACMAKYGVHLIHDRLELYGVVLLMASGYLLVIGTQGFRGGCRYAEA